MSTLVYSVQPPSYHSYRDQPFPPSQFETTFDYVGISSLPQLSPHYPLHTVQTPPLPTRQRQSSSPNLRRISPRASEIALRSPPMRDRTPIRHHRTSISREASSTRQEALLAYVSEQQNPQTIQQPGLQQSLTPQPAANAPVMFDDQHYEMQVSQSYPTQTLYYNSPPVAQHDVQYLSQANLYGGDTTQMRYYPLQSASPHLGSASGMNFNPQETLYTPPTLPSNIHSAHSGVPGAPGSAVPSSLPTPAPLESSRDEYHGTVPRPKPQCFEHGCNGREFSTFSNLLRHQRERSGNATKSTCPHCGTEFTRTTARNGHLTSGKCKGKPDQGPSNSKRNG